MTYPTAAGRLPASTIALLCSVVASLLMTGAARAAVITVTPDGSNGTDNLAAAIHMSDANGESANTLVLAPGEYHRRRRCRRSPRT